MKKNLIKIISVLTAIMILSGVFSAVNFYAGAADDVLFEDDFDSYAALSTNAIRKTAFESKGWGINSGWNNTKAGYAATGEYKVPESVEVYLANTGVSGAEEWSNYIVEADVRFNSVLATRATNTYALIVLNAPAVNAGGYEFGLSCEKSGNKNIILRRRSNGAVYTGESLGTKSFDFDTSGTTTYKLKLEYAKGVLKGYLDGTLVLSSDVSSSDVNLTSGYGGFRKNGKDCEVVFDNFRLYKKTDSLFDMPFTGSYTGSALTAMGYGASGVDINTMASYISDDKIYFPKDANTTSNVFYSPSIDAENYKVKFDFKVEEKYGSGTPTYGLVLGAPNAELKDCYYFALQISGANGYVQSSKVRKYNATGGGTDYYIPATGVSTADRQNCVYFGAVITIDADVSYDKATDTTTVTYSVTGGGKVVQSYSITVAGKLKGHAGIFSSKFGGVSFDNFKGLPVQNEIPDNVYFYDDYENDKTMTENGWSHNSGTKSGGEFTLNSGEFSYTSGVSGAASWTDYAVTAKLKTAVTAIPADDSKSITSIVVRSNNLANGGYEFGICVDKTGTYYQLYKRANPSVAGKINGELNKIAKDIDLTATHNMKIIAKGARILCFDGEELIFDVTDTYGDGNDYSAGYAGIRAPAGTGIYDDFTVRKITEEEEAAIAAIVPELPPDDDEQDENIIFKDGFDDGKTMSENGWNAASTTGEKSGGIYTLNYNKATYLTKIEGSDKWDNYVTEADVRYNSAEIEEGVSTAINIVARSTKTASVGYEFGFRFDGYGNSYLRLYKRGSSAGKINGAENILPYTILPDTFYHLKIVVIGNRIICYLGNMKVFDVVDEKDPYGAGYPGIRIAGSTDKVGYTASYDNFTVRKILASDIVDDKKITRLDGEIWFFDDFDAETSLTERGWSNDSPQFDGGAVSLVETVSSIYTSGVEGSEKWTDYTVSAIVTIDKSKGLFGGQTMGATWISARSTKTTSSGYEFGIMTYSSGKCNLRLYDRTEKEDLMVLDGYDVTDGAHQLKMTCQGNVIRCYFDNKLVITASDDTNKMGYAGIRASGYVAKYDNFTVSDIRDDEILNIPNTESGGKSPVTGELSFIFGAAPVVFALSALALAVVLIWATVNRKRIFS